jgi:hypothetical protein
MTTSPADVRPVPRGVSRHAGDPSTHPALGASHIVQFYEHESFLFAAVADFLVAGLQNGQPVLAIVTEPHRPAISR